MNSANTFHIHFSEEAMLHQELAGFAARHSISPAEAVVLPALFENVSRQTGRSVRGLGSAATYTNQELGEYLAKVAKEVAAKAA